MINRMRGWVQRLMPSPRPRPVRHPRQVGNFHHPRPPRRSSVQLMLSICGVTAFCVAGLLMHTVIGVALIGVGFWFIERRIGT